VVYPGSGGSGGGGRGYFNGILQEPVQDSRMHLVKATTAAQVVVVLHTREVVVVALERSRNRTE